ncbi:TPA: hypothetical protein ACWZLO_002781, partial [Klebsiella pneumoniae]
RHLKAKRNLLAFKEQPFYYSEVKYLGVLSITVRGAPLRMKNRRQKQQCQLIKPRLTTVQ